MAKFKCELIPGNYFTAADMLNSLSQQQLVAAALEDSIVLAAEPSMAWLLDRCCVGRPMPDTRHSSSSSVAARVAAATGVNSAAEEWQEQYEQHLARMQSRRRRRARRMPGYQAAAGDGTTLAHMAASSVAATRPRQTPVQTQTMSTESTPLAAHHTTASAQDMPAAVDPATEHTAHALHAQQDTGQLSAGPNSCIAVPARVGAVALHDPAVAVAEAASPGGTAALAIDCAAAGATGLPAGALDDAQWSVHDSSVANVPWQLVQLSCPEAFFLASVLKCCRVFVVQPQAAGHSGCGELLAEQQQQQQHEQGQLQPCYQQMSPLLVSELWHWCCAHAPGGAECFVSRYAAYKHFRSKGWLPLPGLLYGADFVLYQLHPEHTHSDYVVTVMIERPIGSVGGGTVTPTAIEAGGNQTFSEQTTGINSLSLQDGHDYMTAGSSEHSNSGSTLMTWLDAHIMQRLARQVLKQFLLLYVVMPPGLQLQAADCMQLIQVREVLLQRWMPSQHREDGKE